MPIVIEVFHEFEARQNCPSFAVGNQILFENGAVWNGDRGVDPSDDPRERMEAQRKYCGVLLEREERAFKQFKRKSLEQAALHDRFPNLPPGVGPDTVEQLRQGKERIENLRAWIAELDSHLVDPAEIVIDQNLVGMMAEDRKRNRQYVQEVLDINI
jgi:hypothetical protein